MHGILLRALFPAILQRAHEASAKWRRRVIQNRASTTKVLVKETDRLAQ